MKKNSESNNRIAPSGDTLPSDISDLAPENSLAVSEEGEMQEQEMEIPVPERIPAPVALTFSTVEKDIDDGEEDEDVGTGKSEKWTKPMTILVILSLLAFIIVVAAFLINQNVVERLSSPLTVKDEKIENPEFSFVYYYILRSNGVDIFKPESDEILNAPGENDMPTQRDYFLDVAAKTIQIRNILYDDAKANGYDITDADRRMAETYIDWLRSKAGELGVDLDTFIKGYFGNNVSENLIREVMTKQYFSENYEKNYKLEELKASLEQAETAYLEGRNQYDKIAYRVLRIVFENKEPQFVETANLRASEIVQKINGDQSRFEAVAAEYFTGAAKETLLKPDSTLVANVRYDNITNEQWRDWLFDTSRRPGDTVIFSDNNGFPILFCFTSRERQDEPYRKAHFIDIRIEDPENPGYGIAPDEILAFSQNLFDRASDTESISALETTHADYVMDDVMRFSYDDTIVRSEYQQEADAWLFDPERKPGDKIMIESAERMTIIYFSEVSPNAEWFDKVNSYLRMNNFQDFMNTKTMEYPYVFDQNALSYIIGAVQ